MICERWRGLTVLNHFYGTAIDISAWMYDGLRCINCGSIIVLMTGEGNVSYTSYGAVRSARTTRLDRGWPLDRNEHERTAARYRARAGSVSLMERI